jgi:hypothetical protein
VSRYESCARIPGIIFAEGRQTVSLIAENRNFALKSWTWLGKQAFSLNNHWTVPQVAIIVETSFVQTNWHGDMIETDGSITKCSQRYTAGAKKRFDGSALTGAIFPRQHGAV